jgi:hypothetical protein
LAKVFEFRIEIEILRANKTSRMKLFSESPTGLLHNSYNEFLLPRNGQKE